MVRIRRSHRRGRGSIPCTGTAFFFSFLFIEQLPRCTNQIFLCAIQVNFLGSIVVSISACHVEDRGSIPRRGDIFFSPLLSSIQGEKRRDLVACLLFRFLFPLKRHCLFLLSLPPSTNGCRFASKPGFPLPIKRLHRPGIEPGPPARCFEEIGRRAFYH